MGRRTSTISDNICQALALGEIEGRADEVKGLVLRTEFLKKA
jgi:uncharacterized Zn ribbon protein